MTGDREALRRELIDELTGQDVRLDFAGLLTRAEAGRLADAVLPVVERALTAASGTTQDTPARCSDRHVIGSTTLFCELPPRHGQRMHQNGPVWWDK